MSSLFRSFLDVGHDVPEARRRWLGTRNYWLCQGLGWGLLWCSWLPGSPFKGIHWGRVLFINTILICLMVTVSHLWRVVLIGRLARPISWVRLSLTSIPWILGLAMAVTGAIFLIAETFFPGVRESDTELTGDLTRDYLAYVTWNMFLFVGWTAFYVSIKIYRHAEATRRALKDSELHALKAQLNPHFLFNSLNTVRGLIPGELERPREAVTLLAESLRATLTHGQRNLVRLEEELAAVDGYLELEQIRFPGRLRVERAIARETLGCLVPPFLVQTLVENAVKYGISTRAAGGVIVLQALVCEKCLTLKIISPGAFPAKSVSTGMGLSNARTRLNLLFGDRAELTVGNTGVGEVTALARLPVQLKDTFS